MDADARIRKMKGSSVHLTHEAEHAADQSTSAVVAATAAGADQDDAGSSPLAQRLLHPNRRKTNRPPPQHESTALNSRAQIGPPLPLLNV